MLRIGLLMLVSLLALSANAMAATKAIKFGKLWDGHKVIINAVVIVENDKITSVTPNGRVPAGAEVIDMSRHTGVLSENSAECSAE